MGPVSDHGSSFFSEPLVEAALRAAAPSGSVGHASISLGCEAYTHAIEAKGMSLVTTRRDDAENHDYFAQKA